MSTGKLLLGVVAGVAAGALVGILFAPDKGSETRRKISKKGADYAADLKNSFSDLVDGMSSKFDDAKEEASNLADQGKAILDHSKNRANDFKRDVKTPAM